MPSDATLPSGVLARPPATVFGQASSQTAVSSRSRALLDSLGGKATLSVLDQCVVSGTSFVTSVAVGRLCGQDSLGVFFLAWSIVVLIRGVQETVVSAPYTVFSPKHDETLRSYTGSTLVQHVVLVSLSVATVTGYLLYQSWAGGYPGALPVALVLLIAIPLILFREYVRGLCLAHLELVSVCGIDGVVALVQIGALCVVVVAGVLTVPVVYGAMAAACAVAALGWMVLRGRSRFSFDRHRWHADWKQSWSFGRWALATYLVGCSTPTIIPWLLTLEQGTAATGIFAACMTVLGFAQVAVRGLTNLAVPRAARALAQEGIPGLRRTIRVTALMLAAPCLLFCGVAVLAGDPLVVLIFGTSYVNAGAVVVVLAFWLLFNSVGIGAGSGLWAMNLPKAGLIADLLVIVITLAVAWATISSMGPLGAALGMMFGSLVGMLARWLTVVIVCRRDECRGKHMGGIDAV